MCMKDTNEGCVLAERMTKVETKQNFVIVVMVMMFVALAVIAFKLLNTQIYLLTGDCGLRSVTDATRSDAQTMHNATHGKE